MISACRTTIVCVSVILGSRVVAFDQIGRQFPAGNDDNAVVQIVESCGAMGVFVIGQPLTRDMIIAHSLTQEPNKPGDYWAPNRAYLISYRGGKIDIITTYVAGVFTQRYIVVGKSTLGDVLARYGQPPESLPKPDVNGLYRADYFHEGIGFGFKGAVASSARVERVLLYRKFADKNRPSTPCNPRLLPRK